MNSRKVKVENQILVALGCRMTTDIEVAKQLVKTLLHVDIVIVRQHGERERLAKATGTDEKEILVRVLDLLYETCLVNVVTIVPSHMLEVHHAVRYALRPSGSLLFALRPSVFVLLAKIMFFEDCYTSSRQKEPECKEL